MKTKEQKVEKLVERVRLTERQEAKKYMCGGCGGTRQSGSYFSVECKDKAMKCQRITDFIRGAEAQLNKVLNDPGVALIDRDKKPQDIARDYFSLTGNEFLVKYPDVEKEAYWEGEDGEGLMQALENFKSIIPLADALEEEE